MRTLGIPALIATVVSCHLDKLLNPGGGAPPTSHGTPVQLMFAAVPRGARAGRPIGPVRVSVADSVGQPVAGVDSATVSVGLGSNPGGATLSGSATAHPVHGVATFTDLWLDKPSAGYTLIASTTGLPSDTSEAFAVDPGPVTQLRFTVQPSNAAPNTAINPPVEVTTYDSLGNRATNFTDVIRVALGQDGSVTKNAQLSGATTASAVAGVATFANLRIDQTGVGYTLSAALGGATPVGESAPFTVAPVPPPPGGATHLVFTDHPQTSQVGQVIPAVRATVYDASGNEVANFTGTVTIEIDSNPGNGTLSTARQTVTMNNPVAQWTDLSINRAGNGYTLRATSPGLVSAVSDPFDFTLDPPPPTNGATGLAYFAQPITTRAGDVIPPIRVGVQSVGGVLNTSFTGAVWITLLPNPNGAVLSGTRRIQVANGYAVFTDLRIDKAGSYVLHATHWPLNMKNSDPFDITP